jgi:transposase
VHSESGDFREALAMALPYSDDLRTKLLEAYESGVGSLRELAGQFRVSWGYSKKIRARQVHTGSKERVAQGRHGPPSRITEAEQASLRVWLREQPDLTEEELRERLALSGVVVSKSRVGQLLRKMGMRRKKNHSMLSSGILRPTCNGDRSSSSKSVRSRRKS